jgi:hypothetical protein
MIGSRDHAFNRPAGILKHSTFNANRRKRSLERSMLKVEFSMFRNPPSPPLVVFLRRRP